MNTRLVTTGILPFIIDSTMLFALKPELDGLPWDISGGTAVLRLKDPSDTPVALPATITGGQARAPWTVTGPEGTWTRAWDVTDALGVRLKTLPIVFTVTASP